MDDATLAKHLLLGDNILRDEQVFKFIPESYDLEVDRTSAYSFNSDDPFSYNTTYIVRAKYLYVDEKHSDNLARINQNIDPMKTGVSHWLCFTEEDLVDEKPEKGYYIYNKKYLSSTIFNLNPNFDYQERVLAPQREYGFWGNESYNMMLMKEIIIKSMSTQFIGPQERIQKFVNTEKFYLFYKEDM